ncbi:MAG: BadF/BadG/BcrA/BcrD ATPase family protein [Rhodobacterales bacterium]
MTQIDPPFLIGVDGGGTGCRHGFATPDRRILDEATGGRANFSTDCAAAIDNILTATREAVAQAGLDVSHMSRAVAHLGLAGYTGPELGPRVQAGLPFAKSVVTEDTTTTLVGAVGAQDCYLIALGTGTIVGRQKAGVQTCIGGWGYQVSDQASGAWLGHGVLEQTLLAVDGITPASPLSQQMLDRFSGGTGIVQFSLKARPGDFATLAPDVVQAAAEGDSIGRALMARGADYLTRALIALDHRPDDHLCLTGGVGPHYAAYLPETQTAHLIDAKGRALDGAIALALRAAHEGTRP